MADEFERADQLAEDIASGRTRVFTFDLTITPEKLAMPVPALSSEGSLNLLRYGYNEPTRALEFRVGFYMGEGVIAALEAIGEYNYFEPGKVTKALIVLANHKQLARRIEVGRETRPVLYLDLSEKADELLCEQVMLGSDASSIQVSSGSYGHRTMRVAWD